MPKRTIIVAAVQIKPDKYSVSKTIQQANKLIDRAARNEPDLICLPEHWLPEQQIPTPINPIPILQNIAREHGIDIVGGAFYEQVHNTVRLSSPIISSKGKLLGRQFKVHLFRSENKIAKAGDQYNIFKMIHYKLGVLVCYDVDFPEPSRIYASRGAEIIACPSRIVKPGVKPWRQYVTVRCLENRMPIIAPNVYSLPMFDGHTTIMSLQEEPRTHIALPTLGSLDVKGNGVLFQDIDLNFHNRLRKERFADRRVDTYN
jgi:predicted amidohydrolase